MSTTERSMPPLNASERETLEAWLDYYRTTLLLTCEGVDADALRQRSAEPSELSLQGLLQHLGEVERQWFRRVLAAEELPAIHPGGRTSEGHDGGFDVDPSVPFSTVVGQWKAEVAVAQANCAKRSLDHTVPFMGADVSLRWIYNHMTSEYARHCGHADILRERIDGARGA